MVLDKGWIKSPREIMSCWVYDNPWTYKAYMHLCYTVNIKENEVNFNGVCYDIHPGQRITSIKTLASEMNFTWRTVNKVLTQLETHGLIKVYPVGKAFIITLKDINDSQPLLASRHPSRDASRNPSTNPSRDESRDASRQIKKDKKDKKELKNEPKELNKAPKREGNAFVWGDPEE